MKKSSLLKTKTANLSKQEKGGFMKDNVLIWWLGRAWRARQEILKLQRQIPNWEGLALKATSNPSEPLGAGSSQSMANYSALIIDGRSELERLEREYPYLRQEILDTIKKIATPKYKNLLIYRFINYEKWEDVARNLGHNCDYVRGELYIGAIAALEFHLNKKSKAKEGGLK
jgi:hypothetical protein